MPPAAPILPWEWTQKHQGHVERPSIRDRFKRDLKKVIGKMGIDLMDATTKTVRKVTPGLCPPHSQEIERSLA